MSDAAIKFEFDELKMYFGEDYSINSHLTIHQPSIGEIVLWGEKEYYSMVYTLCAIPSDMKSFLYDNGMDWEEINDFEFFIMMSRGFDVSKTSILFGSLDLSKMIPAIDEENKELVLHDYENDITIDRYLYQKIIDYVRAMHSIIPVPEKSFNQRTKMALIQLDRDNHADNEGRGKSILKPLISSMVNSAGFKYKKSELKEIGIVEFMDSVQRIQVIMSADALMKGIYSGMVDTRKIDKNEFNWIRELSMEHKKGENLRIPSQSKSNEP